MSKADLEERASLIATVMGMTKREYKTLKRQKLWAVKRALNDYRWGCVASPAYHEFEEIERLLDKAIEKQSIKNWGR